MSEPPADERRRALTNARWRTVLFGLAALCFVYLALRGGDVFTWAGVVVLSLAAALGLWEWWRLREPSRSRGQRSG